ncbi:MAG: hypothetical protein A2527_07645 [Candidatus Lambdaproteobacteria bacterium RIFOXYD2_FULL_50_16]|uniref:Uncharacterized protein n=1 Tax=Candidatus Lambdaproteobacteria bacterium RIFOXYD2_FULL_50_16 TaxID=1817772 RepID=A0A1F6GBC4_9PROT|nr:MAG: hypothetical protein A2527_07645 [Candidatus Lambdaproteobacteria bacterium RIFOXYD2_FULL_50_16]
MFAPKMQPSPGLVQYWAKLGDQWNQMGQDKQAYEYYKKAHEMSAQVFGPGHQTTRNLSARLGKIPQTR